MRTKLLKLLGVWAASGGLVVSQSLLASPSADYTKNLVGTSVLEMPAKAADLVAKASATDRQKVAIAVVKAAIGLNSSSAAAIVSAVARENPSVAPVAAVAAATLQHKLIDLITRAAVAAAPSQAAKIVVALIKEFPKDTGLIAVVAAEAAPSAGREILAVVAEYVPALKTSIQAAVASFDADSGNLPVQAILGQSYNQALNSGAAVTTEVPQSLSATPSLSPPSFGPPFTPVPPNFHVYGTNDVFPQHPGGRTYVAP